MGQWQIAHGVNEDRNLVVIEIQEDAEGRAAIFYERPEFEDLIRSLGILRSQLSEAVPDDIDPGTRLEALEDPRWKVRTDLWDRGPILLLRHPGYGWLSFAIPTHEAQEMAKWLSAPLQPKKK